MRLMSALGSPGYKEAIGLVKDVMEWADDEYNSAKAYDIIAVEVKKLVLQRVNKLQDEHIFQIAPEFVQQQMEKVADKAKEKIADAIADKIKEMVLEDRLGQKFKRDYPLEMAGIIGSGQIAGEVVKCKIAVIKYSDGTFTIVMDGEYSHDPVEFGSFYKHSGAAFGSSFHFDVIQKIKLTDGKVVPFGPARRAFDLTGGKGK